MKAFSSLPLFRLWRSHSLAELQFREANICPLCQRLSHKKCSVLLAPTIIVTGMDPRINCDNRGREDCGEAWNLPTFLLLSKYSRNGWIMGRGYKSAAGAVSTQVTWEMM